MDYQVRHKQMGIYQCEFLGMGFWHPMSNQPEQGLCRFPTEKVAQEFIKYYVKDETDNFKREEFVIEPFNEKLDFEIQLAEMEER